jgi:hypothetical protein
MGVLRTNGMVLLLMVLFIAGCGDDSSDSSLDAPGLASPEVQAGFPVYAESQLSTMIALVDGTFLDRTAILHALAANEEVRTTQWESMRGLFTDFQQAWGEAGIYWFVLPDGNYYTVEKGLVGQSLADREYFPRVMSGETVIGSLVVSKATGKKSAVMVVPVLNELGQVIGGVGASLFLEQLNEALGQALSLPEGMVFYVLAPDGTTTLHYNFAMIFENPIEMDSPSLKESAEVMLTTASGEVEYEYNGFRKRVRYLASSLTDWRFALGINIAAIGG